MKQHGIELLWVIYVNPHIPILTHFNQPILFRRFLAILNSYFKVQIIYLPSLFAFLYHLWIHFVNLLSANDGMKNQCR